MSKLSKPPQPKKIPKTLIAHCDERIAHKIVRELPLRRLGQAPEVADAIFFLCSSNSSYVTGTEVLINDGQHV